MKETHDGAKQFAGVHGLFYTAIIGHGGRS